MYDYHLHSNFSPDSTETLDDIAKTAIERGLQEICITDHLEYAVSSHWPKDDLIDFAEYKKAIDIVRDKYAHKLTIKCGAEVGHYPTTTQKLNDYIKDIELDFILCSFHILGDYNDPKESAISYFENLYHAITHASKYSVIGHFDFFKRYISDYVAEVDNKQILKQNYDIIETILKTAIQSGKGIEVNTSGFNYAMNSALPTEDILRLYKELGGEIITTGSDSHKLKNIGGNFDIVYDMLKNIGFKYVCTFDNMQPIFNKI